MKLSDAMVDAGASVLREELGGAVEIFWHPDDLAKRVFEAMLAASKNRDRDTSQIGV